MVIKLQTWEPDTCADGERPCRLIQRWEPDPYVAPVTVFVERVCSAHADTYPPDRFQWADGNWKPKNEYIQYQRAWFRWRNYVEWMERLAAGEDIGPPPASIANDSVEPTPPPSVAAPSPELVAGLTRIGNWNNSHNARKNQARAAGLLERVGLDASLITWTWSGAGDARVLTIDFGGQLTTQQRSRVQSFCDIQFGPGKVTVLS